MMLEIFEGALQPKEIFSRWYDDECNANWGAFIPFVGIIREEDEIEALSFDIYEPILINWFDVWQEKAKQRGAKLRMAHSKGDVKVHESSYMAAVLSPKRRVALELIDAFVEDFKANAPIWKYDVIQGERIYAKKRSTPMNGAGLLAKKD
jgi:molybdopterin synthase catalytic subunit